MMYKIIKRLFDIICSGVALILASPIFLVVVIGIKASSPGPLLYISKRVGLNGKLFTMYKFRSMHVKAAGAVENKYLVNNDRIFKFGSFLRKSKLDELPQLLNVFLGDMSFVGPRPYPQSVVDRLYTREAAAVLSVRPGLACLDSLYDYAHGDLFVTDAKEYAEKVLPVRTELAKLYVERKSVALDIHCILRTVQLIFQIAVQKKSFPLTRYEKIAVERIGVTSETAVAQNA